MTETISSPVGEDACRENARKLYKGVALAPMVRASTTPLRMLALRYGASFTYTEELVDRSLSQTIRVENKELQTIDYVKDPSILPKKTKKKLKAANNRPCLILRIDPKIESGKLICQLGTGEPELALDAARRVIGDVDAIDVNMGCPKKFSVSGGMGSALLKDPLRAAKILRTLKQELLGPLGKPLSCKIRLLETNAQTVDFVEQMISAGADAVAIHARTVGHDATEEANWKRLEEVLQVLREKYPDFPFLVNGDFYDREERDRLIERTKVNGVLLGRPALYNTSIFLPNETQLVDKTTVVQEYVKLAAKYDSHYKNTKYVVCEMMSHRRTPSKRVPYLAMKFPDGQTVGKTCNCHSLEALCQLWGIDFSKTHLPLPADNQSSKTNNTKPSDTAPTTLVAGEHKYEDSYFLKREHGSEAKATTGEKKTNDTQSTNEQSFNNNKRSMSGSNDDVNENVEGCCTDETAQTSLKRAKILKESSSEI